ncbi:uncharacterized protein UTRI_10573_B [Ustilago trichophora]|uniref:Uncharacterized protein n=1 Tax=Ustilago trichophora TaxID=86804 RepID=A0A5C3E957_9BASI|nr:uncharacterized protein UTRI_10573_B [Ustilago trichophora]
MAITLQTVLPHKVLPRAPSPNASSPNPGIRSAITQFIPASPDASLDQDALTTPMVESSSNGFAARQSSSMNRARALSGSSQGHVEAALKSPGGSSTIGRKSMSAGAGSRRGIAHSSRILGVDADTQEAFALSQLTNGKVDVSFEGSLGGGLPPMSPSLSKGKGKARDGEEELGQIPLFDVDLESGQPTASNSSHTSRAGKLLQPLTKSMPWNKSKSNPTPAYQAAAPAQDGMLPDTSRDTLANDSRDDSLDFARPHTSATADYSADDGHNEDDDYHEGLGAFDDDREQLLYAGADDAERPGYFASGDRSFGYNSLQGSAGLGGYGGAVGFEALTWMENGWMVSSSILVAVLVTVAVLISIDVIDWPGDGLGRN